MQRTLLIIGVGIGVMVILGIIVVGFRTRSTATNQSGQVGAMIAEHAKWPYLAGTNLLWIDGRDILRRGLTDTTTETVVTLPVDPLDIIWSPTGTAVLVRHGDEPEFWGLLPLNSNNPTIRNLHPSTVNPAWSDDGSRILYGFARDNGGTITVAKPDGLEWQSLIELPNITERHWWPGEGTYAFGYDIVANPPQFLRFHISSRTAEPVVTSFYTNTSAALPSPDGKLILLQTGTETEPTLSIATLAPGDIQEVGAGLVHQTTWLSNNELLLLADNGDTTTYSTTTQRTSPHRQLPDTQELVGYTQHTLIVLTPSGALRSLPWSTE